MNQKKSRMLRQELGHKPSNVPVYIKTNVKNKELKVVVGILPTGEEDVRKLPHITSTIELGDCTRKQYQTNKKQHNLAKAT